VKKRPDQGEKTEHVMGGQTPYSREHRNAEKGEGGIQGGVRDDQRFNGLRDSCSKAKNGDQSELRLRISLRWLKY